MAGQGSESRTATPKLLMTDLIPDRHAWMDQALIAEWRPKLAVPEDEDGMARLDTIQRHLEREQTKAHEYVTNRTLHYISVCAGMRRWYIRRTLQEKAALHGKRGKSPSR